jgi:tRNA threonylcarbamoyl adenosine modification protein (Sua5/YciO/YrdC/YwlC family)
MIILEIDPRHPQPRRISQAVEFLREGLIAYPTDTVFGVGCDLLNKRAMERLYELKGKPTKRPLSLLCADLKHASEYAIVTDEAFTILRRILPGPYTIILRANERVPKVLLTRQRTVGIRVPAHPVPQAILRELGHPLLTASVPQIDGEYLADAREIAEHFSRQLLAVVDGGLVPNEPSSMIDLSGDEPVLLRTGRGDVSFLSP